MRNIAIGLAAIAAIGFVLPVSSATAQDAAVVIKTDRGHDRDHDRDWRRAHAEKVVVIKHRHHHHDWDRDHDHHD